MFLKTLANYNEQIPDTIKVVGATSAPILTYAGFPIEQWGFALSAIVSVLFIIEKIPVVFLRCKTFFKWIYALYQKRKQTIRR